jgi:hypothetical protein
MGVKRKKRPVLVQSGKPPLHDWRDTGRRFKDHVGMRYEVWVCQRCTAVGKRYPVADCMCFSGLCPPEEPKAKKVRKRRGRGK